MRRFFFGQAFAMLLTAAVFLAVFAVFDEWQKPRDSRIAAMAIATGTLYAAIIVFRFAVKNREWDRPLDVAFTAAVLATILPMTWWLAVVALLAVSAGSLMVGARALKAVKSGDQRWSWEHPEYLLWGQFLATFAFLLYFPFS